MSLSNPEPIRTFTAEQQELIEQIFGHGFTPIVYPMPEEGCHHFSCHFRFARDRNKDEDLPPTTYGQTKEEALRNALAQVADLEEV